MNATLSQLLYGKSFDSAKTSQLALPSNIRGAAFKGGDGIETYVLWAVTTIDKSETASATYTFPFAFSGVRREWDYSATQQSTSATKTVTLTGTPSYFTETTGTGGTNTNTNTSVNTNPPPLVPTYVQGLPAYNYNTNTNVNTNTNYYPPYYPTVTPAPVYQTTPTVTTPPVSYGKISTLAKLLNVRSVPNGNIVTKVPYGTHGVMFDYSTVNGVTWMRVIFNSGFIGWISARYAQAL